VKAQGVRLLDVGVLGPLMIAVAVSKKPAQVMRLALLVTGIATIVYNGQNYLKIEAQRNALE